MAKASKQTGPPIATRFEHAVNLPGVLPKDQEAHVQARAEFLNWLRDYPPVEELFKTFKGWVNAAWELAAVGDQLAARLGLESRSDLLSGNDSLFEKAFVPALSASDAGDRPLTRQELLHKLLRLLGQRVEVLSRESLFNAYIKAIGELDLARAVDDIRPEIERLLAKWSLERPWLIHDLQRSYSVMLYAIIIGRKVRVDHFVNEPSETPPPPLDTSRLPGESTQHATRRIQAVSRAAVKQLRQPPAIRSRKGAQLNPDRIKQDVEIFCRLTIRKEKNDTKYRMADEYRLDRKSISDAVKRVEKWLDFVETLPPGGK